MEQQDADTAQLVGINAESVTRWMLEHVDAVVAPLSFGLLQGGHSNLTYKVTDAKGIHRVLRRPPLGHVLATAHDMAREHRILTGIARSNVPVPRVLALCEDIDVNEAPFYVMEFVPGDVLADTAAGHATPSQERTSIGHHLFELLADLHAIDPDDIGLGELARKDDYLGRQLKRWSRQWEESKTRELPVMDEVRSQLEARKPDQVGASIVHGDWRLPNMLVAKGRIQAVLDWELCTLGDAMADIGYILNNWGQPDDELIGRDLEPSRAGGFGSREEMLGIYAERSGRDVSDVNYYRAFSLWRGAAISEGVLARYLAGAMGSKGLELDLQKQGIDHRAELAHQLISEL